MDTTAPTARRGVQVNAANEHSGEQIELSVVMPCLNERATLGACIKQAQETLKRQGIRGEVVIADNGSTDGSQKIAADLGARVVAVEKRGYGAALQGGIAASRGEFVLMGDADESYDFTQLGAFVSKLREGYDLVMGNRFRGGILPGAMPASHRYLGNPILTAIGRLFFKSSIGDFHCGLRAFRKDAIERLHLRTMGMEFASEMVVKSTLFGLRMAEIPTTLAPDGRDRPPHLRTWRDGWRHLRFLLLYSPRWLFLYPGFLLMLLGGGVVCWLLPGRRYVDEVGFDVGTMVFAAAIIIAGYQAVTFAVFGKVFAITAGLLPEDERFRRLFRIVTLEKGLLIGALLAAGGAAIFVMAGLDWRAHGFGPLDPARTLRAVIPGTILLVVGFQTILSSFFLSVLGMDKR